MTFIRVHSTEHALVSFLEKCNVILNNKGFAGAILMYLSKAFDCIRHDLLIAKLHAYGIDNDISKPLYSYLIDRKQRVKINGTYSDGKSSHMVYLKAQY